MFESISVLSDDDDKDHDEERDDEEDEDDGDEDGDDEDGGGGGEATTATTMAETSHTRFRYNFGSGMAEPCAGARDVQRDENVLVVHGLPCRLDGVQNRMDDLRGEREALVRVKIALPTPLLLDMMIWFPVSLARLFGCKHSPLAEGIYARHGVMSGRYGLYTLACLAIVLSL